MLNEDGIGEDPSGEAYGKAVGERLRHIRRQKRLSLQEVEAVSAQEFKASVLGAYERGERAISVPRLQTDTPVGALERATVRPSYASNHEPTATMRANIRCKVI